MLLEQNILQAQQAFFKTGQTLPPSYRKAVLAVLEDAIRQNITEIEDALYKDLGKPRQEAFLTEISLVLSEIAYARRHLSAWSAQKSRCAPVSHMPGKTRVRPVPYGSVLILSPWNYPFLLTLSPLVSALAAGNCAVIKPSEYAPHTAWCIHRLLSEIFTPDYVCTVQGGSAMAAALTALAFDKIFFTGSTAIGKKVLAAAAANMTPTTLELGGKSPCIVDKSADIPTAARRIIWGKIICCGQTCVAPDYVLVHEDVLETFINSCHRALEDFLGVNPLASPDYGRIVNQKHYNRLIHLLEGADILFGRETNPVTMQISPTLVTLPDLAHPLMKEEIFGPILPVIPVDSLNRAVEIVSQNPNPLAAYFFAKDTRVLDFLETAFSYGGCAVNDTVLQLATPRLPFGGVGTSGMGQTHGKYGFDCFSRPVGIYERHGRLEPRLRFLPYSLKNYRFIRKFFS